MPVTRRVVIATLAAVRPAAAQTQGKAMTTETGLKFIDTTVGTGASPKSGQTCVMHYTGWLSERGRERPKIRFFGRPRLALRVSHRHEARHRRLG